MAAGSGLILRLLLGALLAGAIATVALRARALSRDGAVAATVMGAVATAAGWAWAGVLILFFLLGTAVSRVGAARKARRTAAIVAKGGARDARQVLANGGGFALLALASVAWPWPAWWAGAIGALAAAASDTFATEIGTLASLPPRSILGRGAVPPGTSGGVSLPGTLGGVLGALLLALPAAALAGWGLGAAGLLTAAGVLGSLADSLLGATLQARRWCGTCEAHTEREVHSCGRATVHAGGVRWLDNDAVNLAATLVGAAAGLLAAPFVAA